MASCGTLPDELYHPILELLADDKRALSRAALSCQTLGLEAERVLYRTFKAGGQATLSEKHFLETVTKTPRRAALVRSYELFAYRRNFDEVLVSGLRAMVNLESLTFREISGQPYAERLQLASCAFQLKYLSWGCHSDEVGVLAFLEKQLKIQTLKLDASFGTHVDKDVRLSRGALGELRKLIGGYGTLKMILPGRPQVRVVRWIPHFSDPVETDRVILEAIKANVKMLAFGAYYMRVDLPSISGYLGNLEKLELVGHNSEDKLPLQLAHMPRLKRLIISCQWGSTHDIFMDHKLMATELFENNKSLEVIDIQKNPPDGSLKWGRWCRGRELPTYIGPREAWDLQTGDPQAPLPS